jgi:hypothetical protein
MRLDAERLAVLEACSLDSPNHPCRWPTSAADHTGPRPSASRKTPCATATAGGLAKFSKEIGLQAAMRGCINAFGFYILCSALAIPLILFVGRRTRVR